MISYLRQEGPPIGFLRPQPGIRLIFYFLCFGVAWILLTDLATSWFITQEILLVSVIKGIAFVIVSALIFGYFYQSEWARRLEAEQERSVVEETFKHAFEGVSDALLVISFGDRTILDCNEGAETLFGYSKQELIGLDTRRLHVDDDHFQRFAEMSERVLEREQVFRAEFEMRRKDGEIFPTQHLVICTATKDGTRQVFSVVWNLTERKNLEEELRQGRERLSAILEAIRDAVILIDRTGIIRFANPAVEEEVEEIAPEEESLEVQGEETILLIEDEKSVRRIVIRMLEKCGYTVFPCETGAVAQELFRDHSEEIDLILCDTVLPDKSGPEIINALEPARLGIPVLFMTGYIGDALQRAGVENDNYPPPFRSRSLIEV